MFSSPAVSADVRHARWVDTGNILSSFGLPVLEVSGFLKKKKKTHSTTTKNTFQLKGNWLLLMTVTRAEQHYKNKKKKKKGGALHQIPVACPVNTPVIK